MGVTIITREGDALARLVSFRIPDTLDDAIEAGNALGGLTYSSKWAAAALVFAWTEPGTGGRRTGTLSGQLSIHEFSELGIRGLTHRETVARYRAAWAEYGDAATGGDTVTLPTIDFPSAERRATTRSSGTRTISDTDSGSANDETEKLNTGIARMNKDWARSIAGSPDLVLGKLHVVVTHMTAWTAAEFVAAIEDDDRDLSLSECEYSYRVLSEIIAALKERS